MAELFPTQGKARSEEGMISLCDPISQLVYLARTCQAVVQQIVDYLFIPVEQLQLLRYVLFVPAFHTLGS